MNKHILNSAVRFTCLALLFTLFSLPSWAQSTEEGSLKEPPSFKMVRAEESYTYLRDKTRYKKDIFDALKYIPLNKSGNAYLSFGGQARPRFEHFSNRFWQTDEDESFYSQRLALHTSLVLGKNIRLFGELYHGYTSHEQEFANYDNADLFQAFVDIKFSNKKQQFLARLGRQELGLGATRLLGIREGPNIRRSFDMARFVYTRGQTKIQAFYGKEVIPLFEVFDNAFSLFDDQAVNPQLWGLYSQFKIKGFTGLNELYYLGFQANNSKMSDVVGNETRHTIGLRRFGKIGKHWKYNTEVIYQFGELGTSRINAFNIDTDWHFEFVDSKWKWSPGLKLEYSSGDRNTGDTEINSFNPMFVNPAFYSLAANVTPVNLMSVHPSISIQPVKKLRLYAEWAMFWRASANDALYRPTRFINRPANGASSVNVGHQLGFDLDYEINRHIIFALDFSYFFAGDFLKESGEVDNILHIAPTLNFRF